MYMQVRRISVTEQIESTSDCLFMCDSITSVDKIGRNTIPFHINHIED